MRLKLDENQPRALLAVLRGAGHEVDTAAEEGLGGKADAELVARCQLDQRAMLTFDLDFADLRQYAPEQYSGLLVLRLRSHAVQHVLAVVRRFCRSWRLSQWQATYGLLTRSRSGSAKTLAAPCAAGA